MSHVLFTWELGGGLGHLATMRSIALPLLEAGHRISLAVRDLTHFHELYSNLPIQVLQAPFFQGSFSAGFDPPSTFPHILYNCCCGDLDVFCVLARAWHSLFDSVKPDLVLFDHSPTAIFASRGRSFHRATINNGFFSPPAESPLPSWRSQSPQDLQQYAADEQRVLDQLNRAGQQLGQPALHQVSDLYSELDANFLCTYPELDHFPDRQRGNYVGTWDTTNGEPPHWPTASGPKIFAYLKKFPSLPVLLFHLAQLELPTIIYAPGAITGEFLRRFRNSQSNVVVANSAVDLQRAAADCDFAITNGTHGTIATMLRAGKPTLNIPLSLEQRILCDRICQIGAGVTTAPHDQSSIESALQKVLTMSSLREGAKTFSEKYKHFDGVDRMIRELGSIIQSGDHAS